MRMNSKLLKTVKNKSSGTRRNEGGYNMEDDLDYIKDKDPFAGHKHNEQSKKQHSKLGKLHGLSQIESNYPSYR